MNDILNNVDQIHVKLKRNLEILMAFLRTNIENNNNFLLFFRGRDFSWNPKNILNGTLYIIISLGLLLHQ